MQRDRTSATVAPMRSAPMPLSVSTGRASTPQVGWSAIGVESLALSGVPAHARSVDIVQARWNDGGTRLRAAIARHRRKELTRPPVDVAVEDGGAQRLH